MLEKRAGRLHIAIDQSESLAGIQNLETEEYIIFHIEADFFRDPRDWEEGFRLDATEEGATIQNSTQVLHLTLDELAQVNRFFLQYRQGLLV